MKHIFIIFVLSLLSNGALSTENELATSSEAILAAKACYHWGGEVGDQTPERNEQIKIGIESDCPKAKKLMENAFFMYPNNESLFEHVLYLHDFGFMSLPKGEVERLCSLVVEGVGCNKNNNTL